MPAPVHYRIIPADPGAHLYEVTLTVARPAADGQRLTLPAWIPGSYMIREFARNIVRITATCRGRPVGLTKVDKHTWDAAPCSGPLQVTCQVYAWDLSVRTAHLDQSHGFFNGTSVFLRVHGQDDGPHTVEIVRPRGRAYAAWRVATSMPRASGTAPLAFGLYQAGNYDELIDHPVELGSFTHAAFRACGVPHEVVITGRHDCDTRRLVADLKKICEAQIRFFHGANARARDVPFDRYVFLVMAVGDGYGGLEHRASTALICSRDALPYPGMKGRPDAYVGLLGLCSHEYFHIWNVKRIKPAAFAPYDLTRENHTRLLWAFEGFTSYYDDLFLRRAGLIDTKTYLDMIARTVQGVLRGSGRLKQSAGDSSFDAWVKFYRQDENAPNAIVNYYTKGSLIALGLDLLLRTKSGGARSLDDVMRRLWREYGAGFERHGKGVPEDGLRRAVLATAPAARRALTAYLNAAVDGTTDLPLAALLRQVGVNLKVERGARPALGARVAAAPEGIRLTHVLDGGGAQAAGLSAADLVIAIDGLRASTAALDAMLARKRIGGTITVHAFRRDELLQREVRLGAAELAVNAARTSDAPAPANRLARGWLGE